MSAAKKPRLLPLGDVAERLSVSRATVYRMAQDGRLPVLQLGGRGTSLRVSEDALEEFLCPVAPTRDASPGPTVHSAAGGPGRRESA